MPTGSRPAGVGWEPPEVARLVGQSEPTRALEVKIARVAIAPPLAGHRGETGTGKELITRAIHRGGSRGPGRLRPVNCAVLGDELFTSELFGHPGRVHR